MNKKLLKNLCDLPEKIAKRYKDVSYDISDKLCDIEEGDKEQAARLSRNLGAEFIFQNQENKNNLLFASNLLTQALLLADSDPNQSKRLITLARRIGKTRTSKGEK